jgi:hypothetical protein
MRPIRFPAGRRGSIVIPMGRRLTSLLFCVALSVALQVGIGAASATRSPTRHGAGSDSRLVAFVDRVNDRGQQLLAPAGPCSVAGDGCVRGCTIPVAGHPGAIPAGGECGHASRPQPCRELIAADTSVQRPGDAGFCGRRERQRLLAPLRRLGSGRRLH